MSMKNYHLETIKLHVGQEQTDVNTDACAVPMLVISMVDLCRSCSQCL